MRQQKLQIFDDAGAQLSRSRHALVLRDAAQISYLLYVGGLKPDFLEPFRVEHLGANCGLLDFGTVLLGDP